MSRNSPRSLKILQWFPCFPGDDRRFSGGQVVCGCGWGAWAFFGGKGCFLRKLYQKIHHGGYFFSLFVSLFPPKRALLPGWEVRGRPGGTKRRGSWRNSGRCPCMGLKLCSREASLWRWCFRSPIPWLSGDGAHVFFDLNSESGMAWLSAWRGGFPPRCWLITAFSQGDTVLKGLSAVCQVLSDPGERGLWVVMLKWCLCVREGVWNCFAIHLFESNPLSFQGLVLCVLDTWNQTERLYSPIRLCLCFYVMFVLCNW